MNLGFIRVAAGAAPLRVADCTYNRAQIADAVMHYSKLGAEVIFFPQLCITGATCGDLFLQKNLSDSALISLSYIAEATKDYSCLAFVGLPFVYSGRLYNCMAAIYSGKILAVIPCSCASSPLEQNARYFTEWHGENTSVEINGNLCAFGTKLLFTPKGHSAKIACAFLQTADAGTLITDYACAGANLIGLTCAVPEHAALKPARLSLLKAESARLFCGVAAACAGEGESTTDAAYSGYCQISCMGNLLSETPLFSRAFAVCDIDTDFICSERSKNAFPVQESNGFEEISYNSSTQAFVPCLPIAKNPYLPQSSEDKGEFYDRILQICAHALAKRMAHAGTDCAVIGISGGLDSCLALLITFKAFKLLKNSPEKILAYTMPCFGTSEQTKSNAELLCAALGVSLKEIDIKESVLAHFNDIEQLPEQHDITFENAQARMRTLVLMDIANKNRGIVIGTGDLSELALGWATYCGDHMSMYGVNAGIPKTVVRLLVQHVAECGTESLKNVLQDILATPVSPELLPAENGVISQKTEDIVGPYELHDFFIYYIVRCGFSPKKVFVLASYAFAGVHDKKTIFKWLKSFYNRFFAQQFKRSCMPDGPMVLDISLSPRGGLAMPSDAASNSWKEELNSFENEI